MMRKRRRKRLKVFLLPLGVKELSSDTLQVGRHLASETSEQNI